MTQSIDNQHRKSSSAGAAAKGGAPDLGEPGLMVWVRFLTCLAALLGVGLSAWSLAHDLWRWALVGFAVVLIGGMGGAVWAVHHLMADRGEFWRRGQASGYHLGWRGLPPDVDDPLLRN